jgi:hypothetical protein
MRLTPPPCWIPGLGLVFSIHYTVPLCPLRNSCIWQTENPQCRRFPPDDTAKAEVQKWLRDEDVFFYRQNLENLIVRNDRCLNKFAGYSKKKAWCTNITVCFTCLHLLPFTWKDREKTFPTFHGARACVWSFSPYPTEKTVRFHGLIGECCLEK